MSTTKLTPDLIEKMIDRFSKASERFVKDIEKQIHLIDRRIKAFVDQGESTTTRLMETLDKELRSQINGLRQVVEHLAHELTALRPGATKPTLRAVTRTTKPAAQRVTKAASARAATTAAARKSPAKRAAA